jgi:hypothetical protein
VEKKRGRYEEVDGLRKEVGNRRWGGAAKRRRMPGGEFSQLYYNPETLTSC